MRTLARHPATAGLVAAVLCLPAWASEGPPPSRVEETYACLQVGLAVGDGEALDLGKPLSPQYHVGARLSGQPCDEVRSHALSAAKVPAVVAALRRIGADMASGTGEVSGLADCATRGGTITFADTAPKSTDAGVELWLEACGEPHQVLATLEAGEQGPTVASLQQVPDDTPEAAKTEMVADALTPPTWKPDKLRIDTTLSRESEDGDTAEDELKLLVESSWDRGANLTVLTFDSDYESIDGETRKREASGRLRWTHDFEPGWFSMAQGYVERNTVKLSGTNYDYLLLQAAGGAGYRWRWSDRAMIRLALLWNEFDVRLIDVDADVRVGAPSVYLSGHWQISERLSAQGWGEFYRWSDGDIGRDIDAELHYELSQHLGFGLRWTYTRDAASLTRTNEDEARLFLRYRF